ncbi:MAG: glycosyltransferase [Phycisphaerales bacterium]
MDPRTGGPPRVALELAVAQASLGLQVTMVAEDIPDRREAVDRFLIEMHADGLPVHRVVPRGRLNNLFAWSMRKVVRQLLPEHDVVHIHGVWEPMVWWTALEARRRGVPYIIVLHGVFAPHAMHIKAWKKKLTLPILYRPMINRCSMIHTTALAEAKHLRCYGLQAPVAVIPNGLNVEELTAADATSSRAVIDQRWPELAGHRLVLFLARVHPIKGLEHLVRAWTQIGPSHPDWRLVIAGPGEDAFIASLKQTLRQGGVSEQCLFTGMVEGQIKTSLYAGADLFVLPSFTENFGMSVAESLAASVPVITTHGTPWPELREHHCGWWIEVGEAPLADTLNQAMGMSREQLEQMGRNGLQLILDQYTSQAMAKNTHAMYRYICGQEKNAPPFVYTGAIPEATTNDE